MEGRGPYMRGNVTTLAVISSSQLDLEDPRGAHVIQELITHRADIHRTANNTWDSLLFAVSLGNLGAVFALLDANADINRRNLQGWNPLACAAATAFGKPLVETGLVVVVLLAKKADPRNYKEYKATLYPLNIAAQRGHHHVVAELLVAKASPHKWPFDAYDYEEGAHATMPHPLAFAAIHNNVRLIELLLAARANSELGMWNESGGWTPLAIAAKCGNNEAVQALLDANANPNHFHPGRQPEYYMWRLAPESLGKGIPEEEHENPSEGRILPLEVAANEQIAVALKRAGAREKAKRTPETQRREVQKSGVSEQWEGRRCGLCRKREATTSYNGRVLCEDCRTLLVENPGSLEDFAFDLVDRMQNPGRSSEESEVIENPWDHVFGNIRRR